MANIELNGYRIDIQDKQALTVNEARVVLLTMDRGLWNTGHGTLRDDVASLRHDLNAAEDLTDDLRRHVLETVDHFNTLKPNSLNRRLLDNKKLPKGGGDKPEPKETKPTSEGPLEERLKKLEKRADDHDARFKENEAHLKEHDNMLGVTKNPEGVWMVVPGGNLHIVQQTANHLGYNRDNDGNVTFAGLNERIVWWPTIIALIAAFLVFTIILAFGSGMIWALGSTGGVLILAAIVHILFNRNK